MMTAGMNVVFHLTGKKKEGLFVGQWAAPLLLFGVYNKLVKISGSDRANQRISE